MNAGGFLGKGMRLAGGPWALRARSGMLALAALLLLVGATLAQGGYDLAWWTVDGGGGGASAGGGYLLGGTAGQADAGRLEGGGYALLGGFWGGGAAAYRLYLPLVWRSG